MSRHTTTTDMEIIKELRERLVNFYRYYDNKAGLSPIPATKNRKPITEKEAWRSLSSIVSLITGCGIDLKHEIETYPLRKDVDDLKSIFQYVFNDKDTVLGCCGVAQNLADDLFIKLEIIYQDCFEDGNE